MAGSFNRATLIGHLGQDPEIRNLPNGGKVANLSVATSESWRDKQSGERKQKTEWHRVVIFQEALVKVAEQYLKKGAQVMIEGKIETRKWQDQSGNDKYSTEIVLTGFGSTLLMMDNRRDDGDSDRQSSQQGSSRPDRDRGQQQERKPTSAPAFESGSMDDDIPF